MVGLVIVTHGRLAEELISVAEMILGGLDCVKGVSIAATDNVDDAVSRVKEAVAGVDTGAGALILTDMFGGTPSNIALSFLNNTNTAVITGVNLPMILKYHHHREGRGLSDLAMRVRDGGQKSIINASDMLMEQVKEK